MDLPNKEPMLLEVQTYNKPKNKMLTPISVDPINWKEEKANDSIYLWNLHMKQI